MVRFPKSLKGIKIYLLPGDEENGLFRAGMRFLSKEDVENARLKGQKQKSNQNILQKHFVMIVNHVIEIVKIFITIVLFFCGYKTVVLK